MIPFSQLRAGSLPRPPTKEEIAEIWSWLVATGLSGDYFLPEDGWFEGYWFAVFDQYQTGGPGYSGKLLYMIWDGMPDSCNVFVWRDGRIQEYASHADCGFNYEKKPQPPR